MHHGRCPIRPIHHHSATVDYRPSCGVEVHVEIQMGLANQGYHWVLVRRRLVLVLGPMEQASLVRCWVAQEQRSERVQSMSLRKVIC